MKVTLRLPRPIRGGAAAAAACALAATSLLRCGVAQREAAAPADPPAFVSFTDATAASGLAFRHVNAATGQKYMQETLGSGVCVFDYDGDGRQDVYFVQSAALPGYQATTKPRAALFRNLGGGRFEETTSSAGVADEDHLGMGCVAGDLDGDADRDLYVTGYGRNVLFRNNGGGTFSDVTRSSGAVGGLWSASATLFDADGDGDLDLYVTNYVDYDMHDNLYCGENRPGYRTVCHPKNFDSQPDALYRNRGDGTFENIADRAGVADRTGKGLGVVAGDIDDDGDQDLYVANDDTPNFLLLNQGDGTFDEVGELAGVALSEEGVPQAGMGTDMADFDGDGRLDLFVTNLSEEMNELYRNEGDGTFSNATFSSGVGPPSLPLLGFGTFFFDADQDGDLDLFVANGHIIDNIALYSDTVTFEQPPLLFRNLSRGTFDLPKAEGPLLKHYVARGAVPFDCDDDGDEDIVMTQNDRPALLLRNDGPSRGHWLTLILAGRHPNRDAVGARVTLVAADRRQVRVARTASSYLSQGDRRIHFGLGPTAAIDKVIVRWPGRGGGAEEFGVPGVDRFVTLEQGKGRAVAPAR